MLLDAQRSLLLAIDFQEQMLPAIAEHAVAQGGQQRISEMTRKP